MKTRSHRTTEQWQLRSVGPLEGLTLEMLLMGNLGLSGISTVGGNDFASAIKSEIDDLRKTRDGMMPQWWKDGVSKSP